MKLLVALALAVLMGTIAWSVGASLLGDDASPVVTVPVRSSPVTSAPGQPSTTASGGDPGSTSAPSSQPTTSRSAQPAPGLSAITMAELATHASTASCWLLVTGRVYDVTTYLRSHPGGSRTIVPWCGKEATVAFATEDGRGEHSSAAYADLERYVVGVLAP